MNLIFSIIALFMLAGCALNGAIPQNPTGNDKLDIYLTKWVETINITACEKVIDEEFDIKAVLCVETETDRKIHIPIEEWEKRQLEDLFLKVSKRDLRRFLSENHNLRDMVCQELELDCSDSVVYPVMPELSDFVEAQ